MFQAVDECVPFLGDAMSGLSIASMNCSVPPACAMQDCSSVESWEIVPWGWVIAGSAVGAGMTVGAGGSVGRAVVANWIGSAVGVWATGAGVGVWDWPEQAMRVARAISKVE